MLRWAWLPPTLPMVPAGGGQSGRGRVAVVDAGQHVLAGLFVSRERARRVRHVRVRREFRDGERVRLLAALSPSVCPEPTWMGRARANRGARS